MVSVTESRNSLETAIYLREVVEEMQAHLDVLSGDRSIAVIAFGSVNKPRFIKFSGPECSKPGMAAGPHRAKAFLYPDEAERIAIRVSNTSEFVDARAIPLYDALQARINATKSLISFLTR